MIIIERLTVPQIRLRSTHVCHVERVRDIALVVLLNAKTLAKNQPFLGDASSVPDEFRRISKIRGTLQCRESHKKLYFGLDEKKISGGKVLFTKSRRVRSRVAIALRLAARSFHHVKDYMGELFRRICKPQAITATAHKLSRIVFHLLSTGKSYNEPVFHKCEEEALKRAEMRLRKQAAHLGFRIIPAETE
jgi:hypothetical protein